MRTRTWVPAGAALLLVVGVLATRGGTAATGGDLLPLVADPPASAEPSPGPLDSGDQAVVVEANGIPGMRLGTEGRELQNQFEGAHLFSGGRAVEPPHGCSPAYREQLSTSSRGWDATAWLVDDVVSAVVLTRWDSTSPVRPEVTTWLGPTLGSPVQAASELPGARTTTERPFGTGGPTVTVVVVPGDGVEVVFSDASHDPESVPEADRGRITTLEVRHPRARLCAMEDLQALSPASTDVEPQALQTSVGLDGLAAAPLGTPVDVVRALPGVAAEPDVMGACEDFYLLTADDASVRLVVVDGVVVLVQASGSLAPDLGVVLGDSVADVQATYPRLTASGGAIASGTVEVVLEDRVLGIDLWPGRAWVPDVDVPVTGGPPVVQGVSVRDGAVDPSRLC